MRGALPRKEKSSTSRERVLLPLYFTAKNAGCKEQLSCVFNYCNIPPTAPCRQEKCVVIIGKCQINVPRSIFFNLFAFTTWNVPIHSRDPPASDHPSSKLTPSLPNWRNLPYGKVPATIDTFSITQFPEKSVSRIRDKATSNGVDEDGRDSHIAGDKLEPAHQINKVFVVCHATGPPFKFICNVFPKALTDNGHEAMGQSDMGNSPRNANRRRDSQ